MRERQKLPHGQAAGSYDPSTANACVEGYVRAKALEAKGLAAEAETAFHNCNYACRTESDRPASPFRELAARYAPGCLSGKLARDAGTHLARFDAAVPRLQAASGAMNKHYAMAELRGALHQATAGLGEGDERIRSRAQQLEGFSAEHAADLERVAAFLARQEVQQLQRWIDRQRAQVADLERLRYARDELRLAKDELAASEKKYAFLVGEAGL